MASILGKAEKDWKIKKTGNIPNVDRSAFNKEKYKFFLNAPFEISHNCCNVMKKAPAHKYARETGRKCITAQMADESRLRTQQWLRNGCNGFELKKPTSNPLSFWTEQDILKYIAVYEIKICSVYGKVVEDYCAEGQIDGQISIFKPDKVYKTTGCKRTGCMLCGFGCHLEKSPNRFELLAETHPKMLNLLDICKNNGITFREAIEWVNNNGNVKIKIPPKGEK